MRWRTTVVPSTELQFAANGRSRRAATWASTSLPRSEPAATTADGDSSSTSWETAAAQAPGA